MKTGLATYCAVAAICALPAGLAWAGTEGSQSTFYGNGAGAVNTSDSNANTFIGSYAGNANTSGFDNVFVGRQTGTSNTTGSFNAFLGLEAGDHNTTGFRNTFIGTDAGYTNVTGSRNVFLGQGAGLYETGSDKLYIDNCYSGGLCTVPFIYGEFDNHLLKVNGVTHVAANNVAKSQLHFSLANADSGGFLTSVLENNFFVSSGARYDGTAGGWTQRSPDTNAVIAGSGGVGYRIFTHTGTAVGSTFTPTVRLHIDYSGQFGINTAPVAGHEIHTSSGAYLTSGGVWTDASSRSYKEHIETLATDDALRALSRLTPVRYNYTVDPREKYVGFIAEDVPELVARKDRKSLSPMDIVAVLTKVVQEKSRTLDEQQELLQKQTRELAQTRQQVAELAAEVHRLQRHD